MRARATALVANRELREAFRRRSLWVVFLVLLVGSSALMIVPELLDEDTTRYDVVMVEGAATTPPAGFEAAVRAGARSVDSDARFRSVASEARARALVDDDRADVAVVPDGQPVVVIRSGGDETLLAIVQQALQRATLEGNLGALGLDAGEVDEALRAPSVRVEQVAVDDSDREAAAAILSLVLYLVLLMLMIQAANGVAIEKANRISEVLLAVVRPGALLFGKVIGVALVGSAALAVAALPVLVKAAAGGDLPAGLGPALGGGIAWIVLGLVLYLTIAGALGALVERQEEAGSVLTPLSILLVATYVLAQSTAGTTLGAVLAIFPLTSPIVMPTRIALGEASTAEMVASLALGVATVVVVLRLGAAIYRRGIVQTGRKLSITEALRSP